MLPCSHSIRRSYSRTKSPTRTSKKTSTRPTPVPASARQANSPYAVIPGATASGTRPTVRITRPMTARAAAAVAIGEPAAERREHDHRRREQRQHEPRLHARPMQVPREQDRGREQHRVEGQVARRDSSVRGCESPAGEEARLEHRVCVRELTADEHDCAEDDCEENCSEPVERRRRAPARLTGQCPPRDDECRGCLPIGSFAGSIALARLLDKGHGLGGFQAVFMMALAGAVVSVMATLALSPRPAPRGSRRQTPSVVG